MIIVVDLKFLIIIDIDTATGRDGSTGLSEVLILSFNSRQPLI